MRMHLKILSADIPDIKKQREPDMIPAPSAAVLYDYVPDFYNERMIHYLQIYQKYRYPVITATRV